MNRKNLYRGTLSRDEAMHRHSTWRCGGRTKYYFEPEDLSDLQLFFENHPALDYAIIGLGSNLLVRDGGFDGVIVSTKKSFSKIKWHDNNRSVYVQCGVPCAQIAKEAAEKDKAGLEFLIGIPGTIGGALKMNAGASGGEIWDFVSEVEIFDKKNGTKSLARDSFAPKYRGLIDDDSWFYSATLKLTSSAKGMGHAVLKNFLKKRKESQPVGKHSCGSVFVNPKGDYAGKLIDVSGLKGFRIGGAVVSNKHANFILNDNKASATDIENLIKVIQKKVFEKTRIHLKTEVKIIGEIKDNLIGGVSNE